MKKKIISLFLAAVLAVSVVSAASFSDTDGHWAERAIERWSGYGVINGWNGKFMPDNKITRGEMAVILDKIMGYRTAAQNSFRDLPEGVFYTLPILKANAAGAMQGDGQGGVRPTANITRQEAAVLIANAFSMGTSRSKLSFSDTASVASWAYPYVAALKDRGVVTGSSFRPTVPITRAEVVSMLNSAISVYAQEARDYTAFSTFEDMLIRADGTTVADASIMRDLIIADAVGAGTVKLRNVSVLGTLIIRGGAEIVLENCTVGDILNYNSAKITKK